MKRGQERRKREGNGEPTCQEGVIHSGNREETYQC